MWLIELIKKTLDEGILGNGTTYLSIVSFLNTCEFIREQGILKTIKGIVKNKRAEEKTMRNIHLELLEKYRERTKIDGRDRGENLFFLTSGGWLREIFPENDPNEIMLEITPKGERLLEHLK